jgi:hypothetical protein
MGEVWVSLRNNNLTSFVAENYSYCETFDLSHNQLTNLVINSCNFYDFDISYNNLTSIQIGRASFSSSSNFKNNQFSILDLSRAWFHNESSIYLGNNIIDNVLFGDSQPGNIWYSSNNSTFDIGNYDVTTTCDPENQGNINIENSPNLNQVILKNGFNHTQVSCYEGETFFSSALDLRIQNCPNLSHICVDELEQPFIQAQINRLGLQNQVQVNSYCSFVPGGVYYTIQGNTKYDSDSNGCDVSDVFTSNLNFSITDGTNTGSLIPNTSGNYSIPIQAGTHTITPVLENPTYFTISPTNVVVNFPTQTSPFTQDFCVTANGTHPDLEVTLLPTTPAIPGFDAVYKLVYKNKGTNVQSGSINLTFNDAVLDFVSANPVALTQTVNNVSWDFTNLQPFETREITLTVNVNTPMETPAVNGGDVLNYTATITSAETDETPNDNTFAFNQTVVNSFDPNDKTCLEGVTIAPSEVGKYVHYMIRFENTGTANAKNIVVKDMIDTAKFDINSLVPIKGSHPFVTNITAGNKVEFIFENINLPFDDATNDGYVLFKIKTLPSLVNGDTFSNSANIYFDYNFPIVTNTATTNIQALSTQDFAFSSYFMLYPNPVNDVFTIETKQMIEVSSITVYNQLGQLVLVVPNAQNVSRVDVSNLSSGNYFIKINSDKGTSNTKFIKN